MSPANAPTEDTLQTACEHLSTCDLALAAAYASTGLPIWRQAEANYATLAKAVTHQLVSLQAAAAIWSRIETQFEGQVTVQKILACDPEALRRCGLSRPKVAHMFSIAEALDDGRLCFERLAATDIDSARRELLIVKGIGPWTADLFLLTALGKVDAFPAGDVGLMESYRLLSGLEQRPNSNAFSALAEDWRPFRGVAAHLLWAWIHQHRDG